MFKGDNHLSGSSREGSFKETITLKWCTPRTNNIGRYLKIIESEKNKSKGSFQVLGRVHLFLFEFLFFIILGAQRTSFCFCLFFSFNCRNISLYSFKSVFSSISELHYCTGAYRISPVDVNSRPSSCLTNFLLNGNFLYLFLLRSLQVNH